MRKTSVKKAPQPVLVSSTSYYNPSAVILQRNNFGWKPKQYTIPYSRKLVYKWDWIVESDFEHVYFTTLVNDTSRPLENYLFSENPTLVSFFATQMIDIPYCLKKVKYAHSSSASNPKLRLTSMLLRHGKRQKVSNSYSLAALNLTNQHFSNRIFLKNVRPWDFIYLIFANRKFSKTFAGLAISTSPRLAKRSEVFNLRGELFTSQLRLTSDYFWFNELLVHEILSYSPTFSFFVNSVNKLKRRHSRGKSGKYEIIWKYVPRYKRLLVVLRWLLKDIQFQKSKTFQQRLERSLETLLFNKSNHLVYQLRQFVHRFVFNRYRNALLQTLRTAY